MDFELDQLYIDFDVNGNHVYLWVADPVYSWFTHIALPTVLTIASDSNNKWYVGALRNKK